MSNAAINRRKSQLFLTNISPVYDTHDEVLRKKLKRGKFPQTKTGVIKMLGLSLQLGSIISWIVLERECANLGVAYSTITSTSLAFIGQFFFFLMFSFGTTVKDPGTWISSDIGFNFIASLLTILTSVLTMKMCKASSVQHLSAGLAIAGACFGICGCVALFLMYRFVEDSDAGERPVPNPRDLRKSIFA